MPLYEYYCTDCRNKFEALRPMSKADASIPCKSCESSKTSRVLSLFAVHAGNGGSTMPTPTELGTGGGCCGGGMCGCSH